MEKLHFNKNITNSVKLPVFIVITHEDFPKLLLSRNYDIKGDYFGPFFPEKGIRFFVDFILQTFKVRSCVNLKDNLYKTPCSMFSKHCLAPCVEEICSRNDYLKRIELLKLFLNNTILEKDLTSKADFKIKDLVKKYLNNNKNNLFPLKVTENIEIVINNSCLTISVISLRNKKKLKSDIFNIAIISTIENEIISFLNYYYKIFKPYKVIIDSKKIKLNKSFKDKIKKLLKNSKISFSDLKITSKRALKKEKILNDFKFSNKDKKEVLKNIKSELKLKKIPKTIFVFDVAHINNSFVVTSRICYANGLIDNSKSNAWFLKNNTSELEALLFGVNSSIELNSDLIILDGGSSQYNYINKKTDLEIENKLIAAAKNTKRDLSYLIYKNQKILLNENSHIRFFLQSLTNKAHNLANQLHSKYRDLQNFSEFSSSNPEYTKISFTNNKENLEELTPDKFIGAIRFNK